MDSEMGLSGKTVLVVGTGISGIAAVNLLATQSANIILLDGNTELSPETVAAKFSEDIHYDLILGDLPDQVMDRIDLAVLSPGVPTDLPFVVRMQEPCKMPVLYLSDSNESTFSGSLAVLELLRRIIARILAFTSKMLKGFVI